MSFSIGMQVAKGTLSQQNIAAATLIKSGPGRIARVSVVTAGSAAGAVNDCNGAADDAENGIVGPAAGNKVATIPNAVGIYEIDWPMSLGIYVTPGAGQVMAVAFS